MDLPPYYPYRSEEARDSYLASYEQIAKEWPGPSESRTVPTNWGQTFVRVSGPPFAQPLMLLPGASSTSLIWTAMIATLSAHFRTYAIDRHGDVGRTACTRRITCAADFMSWLHELFTALEPARQIHLAGLSYGGWLTARYALRFPDRLRSIAMIAPAGVLRPSAAFIFRGLLILINRRSAKSTVRWLMADLYRSNPERVEASLQRLLTTMKYVRPSRPIGPAVLTDSELQSLRTPALFLVGENEKIYSAAGAIERLQRVAPQIRAEIVKGAGHDIAIVQADLVSKRMVEFLTELR